MIRLGALFAKHDYERDGPAFFDARQPAWSLTRTVLAWIALSAGIDVLMRVIVTSQPGHGPYDHPSLLLWWSLPGIAIWWSDKFRYEKWQAKRCEASLIALSRPGNLREAQK